MTQFYADADNGDDTHSGLNTVQTATVSITSSDADDSVLTAAAHNLSTGDFVNIVGHSGSTPDINGANQQITVVDSTNFTIDGVNITVGGTGGTMQEEDGPFVTMDQFTENTRSAGDILTCRRGATAQYDDGTDLTFTSSGTADNPIILEADFDDDFSDDVTSSQTYTLVFGSLVHEASATITVLAAGEWIYNTTDGDNPRDFAYEVASVSGTTLTLKIPFKGSTGAVKSLTVMKANPVWGLISTAFKMDWNLDTNWLVQGINALSDDTSGTLNFSNGRNLLVKDCILENTTTSNHSCLSGVGSSFMALKTRFQGGNTYIQAISGATYILKECVGAGATTNVQTNNGSGVIFVLDECDFTGKTINFSTSTSTGAHHSSVRNCLRGATTGSHEPGGFAGLQDDNGVVGASVLITPLNNEAILIVNETTTVRSGGSNTSLKVTPNASSTFATVWELSHQKLLELSIYATTDSRTYDIYFRPTLTSDWTTDPLATELWIELEYWGHATNNFRRIIKSTGTIDMNGSTAWQKLSVSVAPAQEGLAFLRVWYAKPQEDTDSFFFDPIPVLT